MTKSTNLRPILLGALAVLAAGAALSAGGSALSPGEARLVVGPIDGWPLGAPTVECTFTHHVDQIRAMCERWWYQTGTVALDPVFGIHFAPHSPFAVGLGEYEFGWDDAAGRNVFHEQCWDLIVYEVDLGIVGNVGPNVPDLPAGHVPCERKFADSYVEGWQHMVAIYVWDDMYCPNVELTCVLHGALYLN